MPVKSAVRLRAGLASHYEIYVGAFYLLVLYAQSGNLWNFVAKRLKSETLATVAIRLQGLLSCYSEELRFNKSAIVATLLRCKDMD